MITLIFVCGHRHEPAADEAGQGQACRWCGETRIERVQAPAPRIAVDGQNRTGVPLSRPASHGGVR